MKPLTTLFASTTAPFGQERAAAPIEFLTTVLHFKKGEVLFLKNEAANFFYQIERGQVRIEDSLEGGEIAPKGISTSGDWLGVIPPHREQFYQDTAICLTTCTIKRIAAQRLWRQAEGQHPELYQWLLEVVSTYLERAEKRNKILSIRASADRVIQFLDQWIQVHGRRVGLEVVVREMLPHREIALLTNTSRQTVATLLNELRRSGLFHYTRRYIIVREPVKWKKMVAEIGR